MPATTATMFKRSRTAGTRRRSTRSGGASGRLLSGLLIASAVLPLVGCDSIGTPRHRETRSLIVPHVAGSALEVVNANGSVEALARDRADVSIEATLYGNDLERLRFANLHAQRQGDNTLRVWVEWPGGKRLANEGAAVSLNLPEARGVNIRTSNGNITLERLGGHADLQTSNGRVTIDTHDGSAHATTSNGRLQAAQISGDLQLFTSNGRIVVTDAFGPVRAESSNANAYVSTMPGNTGPVRVRTSNGNITLDLGEGFEGILKADTSNGRVRVSNLDDARLIESSSHSVELRIGADGEVSALRTSNGSVNIQGR